MYTLPKLKYSYKALEPYIDTETVKIHHTKHHQTYIDNVNNILSEYPNLQDKGIDELITSPNIPENIKTKLINNAGGIINHNLYWEILTPKKTSLSNNFKDVLENTFGNIDIFKEKLSSSALSQFGSGWGWLVVDKDKLNIVNTPNQNSPVSDGQVPLLGIDVWEHAYYLKYQNRRADYIKAFWNIVNWNYISQLFERSQT